MDATKIIDAAEFLATTMPDGEIDPSFGFRASGRCKVFLSQVAEVLDVPMAEIAAALPALLAAGLHLCRCDLVEAFDLESVRASHVRYLGIADFHMVVVG